MASCWRAPPGGNGAAGPAAAGNTRRRSAGTWECSRQTNLAYPSHVAAVVVAWLCREERFAVLATVGGRPEMGECGTTLTQLSCKYLTPAVWRPASWRRRTALAGYTRTHLGLWLAGPWAAAPSEPVRHTSIIAAGNLVPHMRLMSAAHTNIQQGQTWLGAGASRHARPGPVRAMTHRRGCRDAGMARSR